MTEKGFKNKFQGQKVVKILKWSAAAGPISAVYAPRASIKVATEAYGPQDLMYSNLSRCYCQIDEISRFFP